MTVHFDSAVLIVGREEYVVTVERGEVVIKHDGVDVSDDISLASAVEISKALRGISNKIAQKVMA